MDFGINRKRAIVCAGSKGAGKACTRVLAGEGVNVTKVACGKESLEAAAREIRNPGACAADNMHERPHGRDGNTGGKTLDEVARQRLRSMLTGRFGEPFEFAQLCAYSCFARASCITGQNFLMDGGSYPGTL